MNHPSPQRRQLPRAAFALGLVVFVGILGRFAGGAEETAADPADGMVPWPELAVAGAIAQRGASSLVLEVPQRVDGGRLTLPRLNNVVLGIDVPSQPSLGNLRISQTPQQWSLELPAEMVFPARIRVQTEERPYLAARPYLATVWPDGAIVLDARHAIVHGEKLQFEPQTYKNTVGYWVNADDWAEWRFRPPAPGDYRVRILQGCGAMQGGSLVRLSVGTESLELEVVDTGHFQNFVWRDVGTIRLSEGAEQTLRLKVLRRAHAAVMDVRQIRLEPIAQPIPPPLRRLTDVAPDLVVPALQSGAPQPGRRVRSGPDDGGTAGVYHALYLPTDWQAGRRYPVLVELPGNGDYHDRWGDRCSGRVDDACLGFGISGGYGYIWLTLPFLNDDGSQSVTQWWGDPPQYRVAATLRYWSEVLDRVCTEYGGDPDRLVLIGFSRGSIACNYLGLSDDQIASRWRGFVCDSHYDGVLQDWPYPAADRESAQRRLARLEGRPQFICSEAADTAGSVLDDTRRFLAEVLPSGNFTLMATGFQNHADRWSLRPSPCRARLRQWLQAVCDSQ